MLLALLLCFIKKLCCCDNLAHLTHRGRSDTLWIQHYLKLCSAQPQEEVGKHLLFVLGLFGLVLVFFLRGDANPLLTGYSTLLFYHLDYPPNTNSNSSIGLYTEIKHLIAIDHPRRIQSTFKGDESFSNGYKAPLKIHVISLSVHRIFRYADPHMVQLKSI